MEVAQRRAGRAADRGAAVALDVGVDQVEEPVGMGQARRPDAARIGIAEHVELAGARRADASSSRQCTRSREWWICTPGNHSKVDVAM